MHKVFISHHHGNDQGYKEALVESGKENSIFVDRSVDIGIHICLIASAIGLLDEADWSDIAKVPEAQADPIFGPGVQHELQVLHQHIRNSAGA